MAITILDPTVAAAVAAATSQEAQRAALLAQFGSADVTVRAINSATLRETMTYGAWVTDSLTPRGATLGPLLARSVASAGAPTSFVFRAGSTDVFSLTGAVSPDAADIVLVSGISVSARTNLSDGSMSKVTVTADPALPATGTGATEFALSLSASAGANNVPITVTVTPNGQIPLGGGSVTLDASNGGVLGTTSLSFTSGSAASQGTTLTRTTSGTSVVTMTNNIGLSNAGSGASFTSSSVPTIIITGPSGGLARTVSGLFTVSASATLTSTVIVTLSDGDSNSRFYPASSGHALGTVSISPASPVAYFFYAPAASGAKSITATNNGGLTNPAPTAYTATAAVGSATPFRLTRGGSTIGSYARLQQCRDAGWQSGDVVKVAAGTYAVADDRYDVGSLTVRDNWPGGIHTGVNIDTLTIEAEDINDPPFIDFSWWCAGGIWSGGQPQALVPGVPCHNITMTGIHMRGFAAPAGSTVISAAIWQMTDWPATDGAASTFTFDRCLFHGWGDGIKGRNHSSTRWVINSCVFIDNSDAAAGLHHDIYIDRGASIEVVGCTFTRTGTVGYKQSGYGHFVKSRCRATTVKASRLHAYMDADGFGGANSLINTPCGGEVEITGNVLIDYGAMSNNSGHNILRSGEQQFPTSGEENDDPLLTTHSYLIAQNTTLQLRGYPLGDGNSVPVFKLYHNPTGNPSGALVATGIPTQALTGSGTLVDVTTVIRNNIVANYDTSQAAAFLADYPNNTLAGVGQVSALGYYTGGTVAGSPAVNDADLEWVGDYLSPIDRTDTNRGARTEAIPAWVPATAWQWTSIAGTRWNDVMKPVSSGGVAPSQIGDPVGSNYDAQWAFGGVAYSRKNHEMWMFGGGHDGTTINALSKWSLGSNSPSVSMVCEPTAVADRLADWALGSVDYMSKAYHTETNPKPKSPHAYSNHWYLDTVDEFLAFGVTAFDEPGGGTYGSFRVAGFPLGGSQWRAEGYWPDTDTTPGTYRCQNQVVFESHDGTALFYARKNTALFKYTSAGVKTTIGSGLGGGVAAYAMRGAAESASRALLGGGYDNSGGTGWRLWFVNLTTGAATPVAVSGAAWPSDFTGYQYNSMAWVPALGRYFALITSLTGAYTGSNINAVRVFEFEPTGASTVTATEKTITGTRPVRFDLMTPMHYDPAYGVLLLGSSPAETLFAIKVA